MNQNKLSSRVYTIIKSAATAAVLPILFIYIMIAKPDYAILNGLAHIVLPVTNAVGDLVTWPIRAVGNSVDGIRELSNLRAENEELQARLDAALANKYACDMAIAENKKLNNELNMVSAQPYKTTIADVIYNNSAFHNSTFMINRGSDSGIKRGNVVVSMDNKMAGIVIDAGGNFSRVRAITDSDSNIAVRIAGTGVYGFLKGDEIIKFTARTILENVSDVAKTDMFVGHIGGDDFVAILNGKTDYEEVCRQIISKFDTGVKYFFTEEDLRRGFLKIQNRKGRMEHFPLTSISIGVVVAEPQIFTNVLEIGEIGAQVKHIAKKYKKSCYAIDRRKH